MRCFFCRYQTEPYYKDIDNLAKFNSQRKKILGRDYSGLCAKHQRKLTKQIKYARHLGLLPYVSYQGVK
ncbi:30S ribosomal protein S18 [Candidatus Roizmanbacteria bacterium CG02_land_8_20_14_3_00_36_15]|uniref:30S ribosomal protein S18 n=2 Tax=Candidatus Roizmaniibacteriota TaxID=1752723 RepID=A0A2M8KKW8_9BACT|nr:MAG: 30S ribosomal protein S18 [Candidatus Roizmanbacteria bacterium CG03_land_8_20_14_0_80_36_21]PIV37827.1 MAG: 30S ribosomal protein S18 [Candidatus Roizmanbacteria bacterium CG02_land_8_20_14_3_00_36_15]PIY70374.1 MAG: 30S ribosomal protein S18 [Candidatus Roizmanbacteria bacterium CG_4_10_14_0_8_um_filter_36_36]PJA52837.1 MAG: 30S ribosomal protein S18 [Candidatus Roizmanbacteria bacterium CG_4_9_14_3_um_filter_36_11]PJC81257.1 MAG: 30S ribosomal protein S18 [Candidatus Roizmanbacteria 